MDMINSNITIPRSVYDDLKKDLRRANEISDLRALLAAKDEEIREKDEVIRRQAAQIDHKDEVIRKNRGKSYNSGLILSIQKKIDLHEKFFAPDLTDQEFLPDSTGTGTVRKTHERVWQIILSRADDPRIKRLVELLQMAQIPDPVFCATLDGFFRIVSSYSGVGKGLSKFDADEIEKTLRELPIRDPMTIRCITKVLYLL